MSLPAGYDPPLLIKVSSMSDTTCRAVPLSGLSVQALVPRFLLQAFTHYEGVDHRGSFLCCWRRECKSTTFRQMPGGPLGSRAANSS